MRTIQEIKDSIAADFMENQDVAKLYGFTPGETFTTHFSKASIESVFFYIFACAAWVLENLFVTHKKEVETIIDEHIPHRPKWYRDKVLAFMKDKSLIADTDKYDTTGMNDDQIAISKVVRHAVAIENSDASILTIKVAGESGGMRQPLDKSTEDQLAAYISEFKDAGVRINLVNIQPDTFNCEVDIYYNAMLLQQDIKANCEQAIKQYVENLPFNGEYTNMSLVDCLQTVEGVKIVEFKEATAKSDGESTVSKIDARYIPAAGYFRINSLTLNMKAYE